MASIARALMANPKLLLCDEISLGLAPLVIKEIYLQLERVVASGTTLIVVEQDIKQAMAVADRVYCLREGQMVLEEKTQGSQSRTDHRRVLRIVGCTGFCQRDPGRYPLGRSLRVICGRAFPYFWGDAPGQYRPWRPDDSFRHTLPRGSWKLRHFIRSSAW